ncbi:VWA domain-containing protein [Siminovitchia sp. FSL H7-0308]|uniref:vWA domain-containing protein n=1 Tax=unclassified Siminovitchia TaxID=2837530 RepID=UPI0030D25E72
MKKYAFSLLFTFLVLAGCNAQQDVDSNKDDVKKEPVQEEAKDKGSEREKDGKQADNEEQQESFFSDLQEIPKNANDLINQPAGPFGDRVLDLNEDKEKIIEAIKDMPALPKEATEEDYDKYFRYVYGQVASDFPDPQDIMSKWEFAMSGNPDLPDEKYQFKENYNIEVILDSSGSMANVINGKTMMDLAKETITDFLSSAPAEANVSLRVYGHKGSGSDGDKKMSCSSIEQLYGYETYNESTFQEALKTLKPSGWTPISGALKQAREAMEAFDPKTTTNLIYLVSDGVETCDGDPVQEAKALSDSGISPIINIIGFNVDSDAQKQLKEMARIADGTYTTVNNGEELQEEFKRADEVLERWEEWKKDSIRDVDHQRVEQSFEIIGFSNNWGSKTRQQFLNLNKVLTIMKDEGKIDVHQKDELRNRNKEVDALANQIQDEIRDELDQLNVEKAEEIKKQINEKYQSNTTTE